MLDKTCEYLLVSEWYPPATNQIITLENGEAKLANGTYAPDIYTKDEVRSFCNRPGELASITNAEIIAACRVGCCLLKTS